MKKIAIIGASRLQNPLISKAKEMGLETHVFAWKANDIGEFSADFFYPISITEKERILQECKRIGINGICTIASDLASITVNYVANRMNLIGNSDECTYVSTNKKAMRKRFEEYGDPSPRSIPVKEPKDLDGTEFSYPVIVKPVDRSGSRGIFLVDKEESLPDAIRKSMEFGFEKTVLVEEFVTGQEYSAECISWKGRHELLAITKKYTTGSPNFIETGHMEPSGLNADQEVKVKDMIHHALTSLGIEYGASHSEFKIDSKGNCKIIEIGARMGGDFIGSTLVYQSTGIDFLKAVIDISLGNEPVVRKTKNMFVAVRFVFSQEDADILGLMKTERPELLLEEHIESITDKKVTDSSNRFGYWIMVSDKSDDLIHYMPKEQHEQE